MRARQINGVGSLEFEVQNLAKTEVLDAVEASYLDQVNCIGLDDLLVAHVHLLLHFRDQQLKKLEFYKDDLTKICFFRNPMSW